MSLQCMTDDTSLTAPLVQCEFTQNITDPIPTDQDLLRTQPSCTMKEANSKLSTLVSYNDGSCYAEATFNYKVNTVVVRLTHVNSIWYTASPYDDMMGSNRKINSVIQYKINGNLEKNEVELSARIQCKTTDNCALTKLRALLPDLIKPEARLPVFQQVINLLNTPDANQATHLTCVSDDADENVDCSKSGADRCKFEHSKDVSYDQECVSYDSSLKYDIEHRYNVIEELANGGEESSGRAFKLKYQCKKDLCNDEDHYEKVTSLLRSFAQPSTNANPNTNKKDVPSLIPKIAPTPQKAGKMGRSSASLHYPSMGLLLFLLTIF